MHWDELLEAGRRCFAIATDDSHHPGFDSDLAGSGCARRSGPPQAVLAALAAGRSTPAPGPLVRGVEVAGEEVEVRCSPARSVTLVSGRSTGAAVNAGRLGYTYAGKILGTDDAGLITHARLTKPFGATFARIEVTDAAGGRAWTNPL